MGTARLVISRLQELKTQTTQACLNAIAGLPATIMIHGVKTALSVEDLKTDDDPANVITQESVWAEESGQYRYVTTVAIVVERERVTPEDPA